MFCGKNFKTNLRENELAINRIKNFNALFSKYSQWQEVRAKKDHKDYFGTNITEDETYFKRSIGSGYGDNIKISKINMVKIIDLIFEYNNQLEEFCEKESNKRHADLIKAADSVFGMNSPNQ